MTCPCCSSPSSRPHDRFVSVSICNGCGGIYGGPLSLGDSYRIVKPSMSDRRDMDGAIYYDLTVVCSDGVRRRHGWYDPENGLILQVG